MATKNIVPRANGEGGIGTSAKRWLNGFFKNITVETAANVPTAGDSENSTKAASTAWVENVFFAKLVTKLAASTAASISSLNTSSLFYRMLSWALTASGVQYNFTNSSAWYICFGSLLGGLIIQGGTVGGNAGDQTFTFPVELTSWSLTWLSASANSTAATTYADQWIKIMGTKTAVNFYRVANPSTLLLVIGK